MIKTEFNTSAATIRIHDEYFETATDTCISRLSHIVSESYRRRQMQDDAVAAFRAISNEHRA